MLGLLDAIAARVAQDPDAVALIGVGSAGAHSDRFDEHSDLDFFVIATDKMKFLDDVSWLGPVQWSHRDTPDGCKALVGGTFCEFAVFQPDELPSVRFEGARVVWQRAPLDVGTGNLPQRAGESWLVDEVLSNLFVGLHRWLRGEKLAALRMVQGEALDNLLRLLGQDDPFNPARRAEGLGLPLDLMAGGYTMTPQAARAIFERLPAGGGAMREAVRSLIDLASQ